MKKIIYLLLAMPLLFTSCNEDEVVASDETVQVSFSTQLPNQITARSASELNVNKVVCAVFENGEEISTLREVIEIQEGKDIVYAPRLIRGCTYDVVFWAMKDDNYNVDDMTTIVRNDNSEDDESYFDAFTESLEIEVTGSKYETVTLKRPLAQLNLGVTADDWNAVASEETFGMTPTKMFLTMTGKNAFNALTGVAVGEDKEFTYTLNITGADLQVEGVTYKSIAMCYVFPDAGKENVDITFTIYDQNNKVIRENTAIQNVPLEANYCTNVVGTMLTGTIEYTINFDDKFSLPDKNEIL